jgi:hypothetical protein
MVALAYVRVVGSCAGCMLVLQKGIQKDIAWSRKDIVTVAEPGTKRQRCSRHQTRNITATKAAAGHEQDENNNASDTGSSGEGGGGGRHLCFNTISDE